MNPEQLHILRHALGIGDDGRGRPYRNYYIIGPGGSSFDDCRILSALGLMIDHGPQTFASGMHRFTVTELGLESAINRTPAPKITRGRRRYHAFLSIADCCPDMTFRDFLAAPEFADARDRADRGERV